MYYSHLILLALAATPARKAIECGRINDRTMYSNTDTPSYQLTCKCLYFLIFFSSAAATHTSHMEKNLPYIINPQHSRSSQVYPSPILDRARAQIVNQMIVQISLPNTRIPYQPFKANDSKFPQDRQFYRTRKPIAHHMGSSHVRPNS